jgi:hypothetical protein
MLDSVQRSSLLPDFDDGLLGLDLEETSGFDDQRRIRHFRLTSGQTTSGLAIELINLVVQHFLLGGAQFRETAGRVLRRFVVDNGDHLAVGKSNA